MKIKHGVKFPYLLILLTINLFSLFFLDMNSPAQHGEAHEDQASSFTLGTITVTADKITEYIRNNPQQVTVVEREEILERNFLTIDETLNSMPGVDVKPSSGIGSRISIRGSGKASGVLVLLNGRPLNSSQYGGADLSSIPIDIVQSITIFKPPVPVWLGPNASEGAISIITHDFAETPEHDKHGTTRVKMSAGSFGQVNSGISYNTSLPQGSFMITAAGARQDGKRSNSEKDKGDVSIHWDRDYEGGSMLELNGRYYISDHGSPGTTYNPTPDAGQRYEKGSFDFKAQGLAGENTDYSVSAYGDRTILEDQSQSGFISDLEDLKLGIKADTTLSDPEDIWALRMGAIIERDDVEHTLSGEHHRVTAGVHAQYDRHFDFITTSLGLRGDHTTDFDFNPGVTTGLSFEATEKILIKGNAGYRVNVPNFGQLYQSSHGAMDQSRGNPDLREEKIYSYDLGLEYRHDKDCVFQATLFRSDTRDLISYSQGQDLVYEPLNISRAWRHGMELTAKYAFKQGHSLEIDYIIQDSENKETGKELVYTSRNTLKATVKYPMPVGDIRTETTFRYMDDRYSDADGRESGRLDDYVTVDLKLLKPFSWNHTDMEAYLNIYNLFDEDFDIHNGCPDDGLRFMTGLNITF